MMIIIEDRELRLLRRRQAFPFGVPPQFAAMLSDEVSLSAPRLPPLSLLENLDYSNHHSNVLSTQKLKTLFALSRGTVATGTP